VAEIKATESSLPGSSAAAHRNIVGMYAWLVFTMIALVFAGITGLTQTLSTNRISSQLSFCGLRTR